jgi:quercetin dioxygenase-like cupin family protein
MNLSKTTKSAFWLTAVALAFGLGTAVGQQTPPKENKGLATEKTVTLDLGGEIEGMQGRQLRLRVLKLEPGGVIGIHSHKDRPAVAYLLDGTLTEHRDGGATKDHSKGETLSAGKDVTHWEENKGKTPAVLVAADIFKP